MTTVPQPARLFLCWLRDAGGLIYPQDTAPNLLLTGGFEDLSAEGSVKEDPKAHGQVRPRLWHDRHEKDISRLVVCLLLKRGDVIEFDGFKSYRHENTRCSRGKRFQHQSCAAQVHDSMLFSDMVFSGLAGGSMADQIASVYADKGYDSEAIRNYLKDRGIVPRIPYRKNTKRSGDNSYKKCNSVRFVVERFFSWLKSGFHRTIIRYERMRQLSWVCLSCVNCDVFEGIGMSYMLKLQRCQKNLTFQALHKFLK